MRWDPENHIKRLITEVCGEGITSAWDRLLKINKHRFLRDNGRKYVFVLGERNNRKTAIVLRQTKACPERIEGTIDLKKDKNVIDSVLSSYNPDDIFINGDSFVRDYKIIESEFKALMGV
jgi:adenine-specific DNA-methyltransferase